MLHPLSRQRERDWRRPQPMASAAATAQSLSPQEGQWRRAINEKPKCTIIHPMIRRCVRRSRRLPLMWLSYCSEQQRRRGRVRGSTSHNRQAGKGKAETGSLLPAAPSFFFFFCSLVHFDLLCKHGRKEGKKKVPAASSAAVERATTRCAPLLQARQHVLSTAGLRLLLLLLPSLFPQVFFRSSF